jgi:hypothetical protein
MCARLMATSVAHYVDEWDFSGLSNSCDIAITNNLGEVTAYADTDATFVEGKPGFTINFGGLLDPVAGGYDAEMFIDLTSEGRRVGVFPGGATAGNYGYEADSNVSEQPRTAEIAGAIALNVNWQGDTPLVRAVLLDRQTAKNNSTAGTKFQRGAAAATDTIVGVLRLFAAPGGAGSNTLDVTIESDANSGAGGETTRLTFAQLDQTSVALSEVVTAAGAVTDTWWRVAYTYAGAGTRTFNLAISFGIRPT